MRQFVEDHFNVLAMFALFVILIIGHAFMIHAGRTPEQIQWAERLIDQVFVGMLGYLAGQQKVKP